MSGRHTGPINRPRPYGPIDPHGYIRGFAIFCGCLVMVAAILLVAARIGAAT